MISIIFKSILIDDKAIFDAPAKIRTTHIFNDRIIVLYESDDLVPIPPSKFLREVPVTSPESLEDVNRNILMIDFQGSVLWRIKSDAKHYSPWTVIAPDTDKPGRWFASNYTGYEYDIDINTGALSNGLQMK